MNPGTLCILIRLPARWPPPTPQMVLDNEDHGTRARLIVSNAGRLELELRTDSEVLTHRFQTIRPTGVGYCALAVAWGDGSPPALFINGKAVRSLEAAGDEVVEIPLKNQPLPPSLGLEITGHVLGRMSTEERLFVESLHDLERRLASGTSYDLLMASGVVRKLLLDEVPIAHQANRLHRVRLTFQVGRRTPPPKVDTGDAKLEYEGVYPDGAPSVGVTEDQLWQHRMLWHGDVEFTAREVVLAAAHVLGGVHLSKPKTDSERRIVDLAQRIQAMNTPLPLYAVRDVAMVVAGGLLPLAGAIGKRHQG